MSEIILFGVAMDKKIEVLNKMQSDGSKWNFYYVDPNTGEKWVNEYPEANYHGGGEPQLRKIDTFPWEDNGPSK